MDVLELLPVRSRANHTVRPSGKDERLCSLCCPNSAPPRLDTGIGRQATALIPFAAILHLALAIWIYGNRSILSSEDLGDKEYERLQQDRNDYTLGERATQQHTFPLFVMLCIVVAYTVLRLLNPTKWVAKLYRLVCCKKVEGKWKLLGWLETGIDINYTRAFDRGLIKGNSVIFSPTNAPAFKLYLSRLVFGRCGRPGIFQHSGQPQIPACIQHF